jgi:hypothetical protein
MDKWLVVRDSFNVLEHRKKLQGPFRKRTRAFMTENAVAPEDVVAFYEPIPDHEKPKVMKEIARTKASAKPKAKPKATATADKRARKSGAKKRPKAKKSTRG